MCATRARLPVQSGRFFSTPVFVDTLRIAFGGVQLPAVLDQVRQWQKIVRARRQSAGVDYEGTRQAADKNKSWVLGGGLFRVEPGSGMYEISLHGAEWIALIGVKEGMRDGGSDTPSLLVTIRAQALHSDFFGVVERARVWAAEFFSAVRFERLSRLDLAADFQTREVKGSWLDFDQIVTRARSADPENGEDEAPKGRFKGSYRHSVFSGWTLGSRGGDAPFCRIYDKVREVKTKQTFHVLGFWQSLGACPSMLEQYFHGNWFNCATGKMGRIVDGSIWRVEFELGSKVLKKMGYRTLLDLARRGTAPLWRYLTQHWLRIVEPLPKRLEEMPRDSRGRLTGFVRRESRANLPWWDDVIGAAMWGPGEAAPRSEPTSKVSESLLKSAKGSLVTYLAGTGATVERQAEVILELAREIPPAVAERVWKGLATPGPQVEGPRVPGRSDEEKFWPQHTFGGQPFFQQDRNRDLPSYRARERARLAAFELGLLSELVVTEEARRVLPWASQTADVRDLAKPQSIGELELSVVDADLYGNRSPPVAVLVVDEKLDSPKQAGNLFVYSTLPGGVLGELIWMESLEVTVSDKVELRSEVDEFLRHWMGARWVLNDWHHQSSLQRLQIIWNAADVSPLPRPHSGASGSVSVSTGHRVCSVWGGTTSPGGAGSCIGLLRKCGVSLDCPRPNTQTRISGAAESGDWTSCETSACQNANRESASVLDDKGGSEGVELEAQAFQCAQGQDAPVSCGQALCRGRVGGPGAQEVEGD